MPWSGSEYAFCGESTSRWALQHTKHGGMDDDEDDAVTLLLQLLDDLLIYEPGTVLEYAGKKPSRDDLESIQSDTTVRILRILQQYVRPRNEVLRIRRIVTSALQEGNVAEGNVFAEYVQVKEEVERLKEEKKLLTEQLRERSLRKQDDDSHDQAKNMLLGNIFLQKAQKQIQILQIYQRHLNQLIGQKSESQLDNQQTLVPLSCPYLTFFRPALRPWQGYIPLPRPLVATRP